MFWLLGLATIPAAAFGPKRYFLAQAICMMTGVVVLGVWLAAPIAIWQAFGMIWMLAWLLPTTLIIFALAAGNHYAGEG